MMYGDSRVSSPLSPRWRIERDMYSESTLWLLEKEPWSVRAAPILGLLLLVAGIVVGQRVTIPEPTIFQVTVVEVAQFEIGREVLVEIPIEYLEGIGVPGSQVLMRLHSASGSHVEKIKGTITETEPTPRGGALRAKIALSADSKSPTFRVGTLYVMGAEKSVNQLLTEKYLKQRGKTK